MTNNAFMNIILGIGVFIILYLMFALLVKLPKEDKEAEKLLDEAFGTSHNEDKINRRLKSYDNIYIISLVIIFVIFIIKDS